MLLQIWLVLRNFFVIIGMFTVAMIAFKLSRGELEFAPIFGSRPSPAPGVTVPTPGTDDGPRVGNYECCRKFKSLHRRNFDFER